jgi:polysaccharide biosynthesis/export protein
MKEVEVTGYRRWGGYSAVLAAAIMLASCTSLGSSGPSRRSINAVREDQAGNIMLVDLTDAVARQVQQQYHRPSLNEVFAAGAPVEQVVGPGDIIDIAIWEAPPAALFGSASVSSQLAGAEIMPGAPATARGADIPEQMVDSSGQITVPFAGAVTATGRTPRDIAAEIATRLRGQAHDPQVIVRISDNQAANVTVIGEVVRSGRVPLTTRGERLLDAIAGAGGVKQEIDRVTVQVSRGGVVATEPLAGIIGNPAANIPLQAGDVVAALYRPYSFQALGAFNINAEVEFEATGLTLAQALGRIGGLQDNRADVKGVFVFRLEDPATLGSLVTPATRTTPDGKVPVIYRVDLGNPATFFIAQGFQVRDGDVLYVSNAPLVDIQKFVTVLSSTAFTIVSVGNAVN